MNGQDCTETLRSDGLELRDVVFLPKAINIGVNEKASVAVARAFFGQGQVADFIVVEIYVIDHCLRGLGIIVGKSDDSLCALLSRCQLSARCFLRETEKNYLERTLASLFEEWRSRAHYELVHLVHFSATDDLEIGPAILRILAEAMLACDAELEQKRGRDLQVI